MGPGDDRDDDDDDDDQGDDDNRDHGTAAGLWKVKCQQKRFLFDVSGNVWRDHRDCRKGSLSLNKQIIRQKLYTRSSPVLLCHKGKLERKVKDF